MKTCSWAEVQIPHGHFRGTPVVAAPPEWGLPFAPMRPSTYRGPTHIWMPDKYGADCMFEETPVLICYAWGRPPAARGCDRTGQDLPRPQRGNPHANFPKKFLECS